MCKEPEVYAMQYPSLSRSAEDTLPSLIEELEGELSALKELLRRGGWVSAVEQDDTISGHEVYNYSLCTTDAEAARHCGMEKDDASGMAMGRIAADCGGELVVGLEDDRDLDPIVAQFPARPPVARPVAA